MTGTLLIARFAGMAAMTAVATVIDQQAITSQMIVRLAVQPSTFSYTSTAQPRGDTTPRTLDRFDDISGWGAFPSEGVALALSSVVGYRGGALELDFDFDGKAGYAIARKSFPLGTLTGNWAISFRIRGEMRPNTLEFKLLDSSGDNVWWYTIPEFQPSPDWQTLVVRQRQVKFAWGPIGGGLPRDISAIELVVTAGRGGKGSLSIDDLTFSALPADEPVTTATVASAIGTERGSSARFAADGDTGTTWKAAGSGPSNATSPTGRRGSVTPEIVLDLGGVRTYGGLVIDWTNASAVPTSVSLDTSNRVSSWSEAVRLNVIRGPRSYIPVPDGSSRFIRLRFPLPSTTPASTPAMLEIREITLRDLGFAASPTALLQSVATDYRRGMYPRAYSDEQTYWSVVGVSGGKSEVLLSEDGQLEIAKRGPSLEPFITIGNRVVTWADGTISHSLEAGVRPIPSVTRKSDDITLVITALASGTTNSASSYARYRIINQADTRLVGTFWIALRPMQVNPPWQFLNAPGGAARVDSLRWDGKTLHVNDSLSVTPVTVPARVGVSSFDGGEAAAWIQTGIVPSATHTVAPRSLGSALFAWDVDIAAGDSTDVVMTSPLDGSGDPEMAVPGTSDESRAAFSRKLLSTSALWAHDQDAVRISLPATAPPIADAIKANLAWILVNRDGPRIQPGSRSYERSWIRDGSLTSEALLRLGRAQEAKEFAEWYAPFQFASGKVPCCVDERGADPVDENDSNGEFIHLVHEVWRYTGDRIFAERMWPNVLRAAVYLDSLRRTHLTAVYNSADSVAYRGLLPPSISHEGYSAKPMHSYWDDGFALLGLSEAASLAADLGHVVESQRIGGWRDGFRSDLVQSMLRAMEMHGIDYLPGSVELGDFDATSTTTLLAPVGALSILPRAAVDSTFSRYVRAARKRADRDTTWDAYTPYEWRTVGALLRLGRRDDAVALTRQFMGDRRPEAWQQWAEVVWRDERSPKFIGDMPHTWVGSDFIRSALDMFAYERESDSSIVIASGIAPEWLTAGDRVAIHDLRTPWGDVGYTVTAKGDTVTFDFDAGMHLPPGGFVVHAPTSAPVLRAMVDLVELPVNADGSVELRSSVRQLRFYLR